MHVDDSGQRKTSCRRPCRRRGQVGRGGRGPRRVAAVAATTRRDQRIRASSLRFKANWTHILFEVQRLRPEIATAGDLNSRPCTPSAVPSPWPDGPLAWSVSACHEHVRQRRPLRSSLTVAELRGLLMPSSGVLISAARHHMFKKHGNSVIKVRFFGLQRRNAI